MIKSKYFPSALAAAFISLICCNSALADNYRYSTNGGETWLDATTLSAAATAVGSNDAIIEVCNDNDQMFASAADFTFSGNVTIRSNGDSPFTITRNQTAKIVGGTTGKEIVLTNVIFKSNGGTGRFFTMSPGTLRLKTGAKITSDMNGTPNTKCALCSKSNGEIHFEGGAVDGWLSSDEAPVYPSGGSTIYIDAGGIENCVNTAGADGQDSSAIGSNNAGDRLIMTGGFIRNNAHQITSGNPSAVVFNAGGTISLSGGQVTGNSFGGSAGYAIRLSSSSCVLALSGAPVVSDNLYGSEQHNVYISGASLQQTGDLLEGANIGISGGPSNYLTGGATFGTATAGLSGAEFIVNDKTSSTAEISGTNLIWPNGARYSTDNGVTWTEVADAKAAFDAVKSGAVDAIIESRADCQLYSGSVTPTCNLTLRTWTGEDHVATLSQSGQWVNWNISSGLTVTLTNIIFKGGTQENNGLFKISEGGTLRLEEGARVTSAADVTRACIVVNGDLYISGGIISGWVLNDMAPIAYGAATGRVYLSAGGIENCSCSKDSTMGASAVTGQSYDFSGITDPVFVMTGGFIRNNSYLCTGSSCYSAISFRQYAIIEISGGVITNNTSTAEKFCAVSGGQYGDVKVNGNPVIRYNRNASNEECNVYLDTVFLNPSELIQNGNLTAGADIGVYSPSYASGNTFGTLDTAGYTGAEYFLSDRNSALVGSASGTSLVWVEKPADTVNLTIPAKTGLNSPTVTATIGTPTETSSGVWAVAQNSTVTLTYTAAAGYSIDGDSAKQFEIGTTDVTLTESQLPAVVQQIVLAIPAKTGLTVASVTGGNATEKTAGSEYYVDPTSTLTITFAAASGYVITGTNPIEYTIGTTDATLPDGSFPAVKETAQPNWIAMPMTTNACSIRAEGTLLHAWKAKADSVAEGSTNTVNGVNFVRVGNMEGSGDVYYKYVAGFNPTLNSNQTSSTPTTGLDANYAEMLGWFWTNGETHQGYIDITFKDLTKDARYLVQIVTSCGRDKYSATTYAPGSNTIYCNSQGDGWTYGGTLIGEFYATNTTHSFRFNQTGKHYVLNAVQIRDISSLGEIIDLGDGFLAVGYGSGTWHITGEGTLSNIDNLKSYAITNIVFEDGVTGIGGTGLFQDVWSIADVDLGGVTSVGAQSFHKCYGLTNVTSSAAAVTVGDYAFYRCNSLEKMTFEGTPTWGTKSFKLQAAIKMVGGEPVVYSIPEISNVDVQIWATNDLSVNNGWINVTSYSDEERKEYSFFKIVIIQ